MRKYLLLLMFVFLAAFIVACDDATDENDDDVTETEETEVDGDEDALEEEDVTSDDEATEDEEATEEDEEATEEEDATTEEDEEATEEDDEATTEDDEDVATEDDDATEDEEATTDSSDVTVFDGDVGTDVLDDITILTGGTAGVYYPLGVSLADIIDTNTDANSSGVSSGASVTNVNELADGDAELALVQNDIAYYAFEGINMFDSEIQDFSGLFTIYPETVQVVVMEDSGIESISDLDGMRVAIGDAGSGTEANAIQILEAHGLSVDDISPQYLSFADASTNLQDGNIDAAFITAGTPTGAVQELSAQQDIKILSFDEDAVQSLLDEYPYYTEVQLGEDDYENFDATATTVAVQAMVIVSNDVSEDQVYDILTAIFDNLDTLGNAHVRGEELSLDTALEGMSIPLHPGAKRFFDEHGNGDDNGTEDEDSTEDEDTEEDEEDVEEEETDDDAEEDVEDEEDEEDSE